MELARAWTTGSGAADLASLLGHEPATAGFVPEAAIAEAQTSFDSFRGGRRNHDLLVVGTAAAGRTVVAIEGKADESFGERVGQYSDAAQRRVRNGERTFAPDRLAGLLAAIVGRDDMDQELRSLRYQLFSAIAGTIAAATDHNAAQAVFVVHEFATTKTTDKKRRANAHDFAKFLDVVFPGVAGRRSGSSWLIGPAHVPGSPRLSSDMPLFIGKLVTKVG
jgi:hypothetical protein